MKDSPEKISPLRRRMIEDMRMRKLATHTQSGYIRAVRHFAGYLGRSPDTATDVDLVVVNATVYTMDPSLPKVEAFAVRNGRFERLLVAGRRPVDCGGRRLRIHAMLDQGADDLRQPRNAHVNGQGAGETLQGRPVHGRVGFGGVLVAGN